MSRRQRQAIAFMSAIHRNHVSRSAEGAPAPVTPVVNPVTARKPTTVMAMILAAALRLTRTGVLIMCISHSPNPGRLRS